MEKIRIELYPPSPPNIPLVQGRPPKAAGKFGPFGGPLGLGNGPGLRIPEPCVLGWGVKGLGLPTGTWEHGGMVSVCRGPRDSSRGPAARENRFFFVNVWRTRVLSLHFCLPGNGFVSCAFFCLLRVLSLLFRLPGNAFLSNSLFWVLGASGDGEL